MLSNAVQLIEGCAIKRHQKAQRPQGFYKRPACYHFRKYFI